MLESDMDMENDNYDRIGLRVTAFSAMGSRKYMEDYFTVAYQKSEDGKDLDYSYFGVFDGHGGDSASIFAKNHLLNFITNEPEFWSNDDAEVLQAIRKGFLTCHEAMWKDLDKWPQTSSGLPSTAGTTASVAFVRKGKLYIGHCGDSGIVLGRTNPKGGQWIAQALTNEHKPESPEELARIESFGGKVQKKQGIHRVVWYRPKNPQHQGPIRRNTRIEEVPFLAVARSLGDLWSYNYKTQKFVVSPEPDVEVVDIDTSCFKCLIFASDGLWNVIEAEASVESVYETERRNDQNSKLGNNSWRNPSRILVEAALEKWRSNGLRADNTSVVCVMLDPPNKRNMYKFCRPSSDDCPATVESKDGGRTIFDYSTSEAYNLDFMSNAPYAGGLTRQNAAYERLDNSYYPSDDRSQQQSYSSAYQYESYSHQTASTSAQQSNLTLPGSLTYQTSSNESAFVKACCRNNYRLASANEQIPYHSTYEQHRAIYENMAMRPYPPLHYAYRPVPTTHQSPLPSLHTNLYDHHQSYLANSPVYRPMERYNYLRPTPEEVAALHNENEQESDSDSNTPEFSDDEESDEAEEETIEAEATVATDDSIQIFEISSSSFIEPKNGSHSTNEVEFKKKPTKSNDKENSEERKKKVPQAAGRFYATRQTDRKMRSGNVGNKTIGREKLQRKMTRNIRKVAKTLIDQKNALRKFELLTETSRAPKVMTKCAETSGRETQRPSLRSRALRGAQADSTFKRQPNELPTVRSLRSNSCCSNVMDKSSKPRNRSSAFFDNSERTKDRRMK